MMVEDGFNGEHPKGSFRHMDTAATPPPPKPVTSRRRRRHSPDEIRDRMFIAAREILQIQGVVLSLDDLGLDDVIARAGVPRSSVYKIWPYKSDFIQDLLKTLAGPDWMGTAGFDVEHMVQAAQTVLDRWDDLATQQGRRSVLLDVVRTAIYYNYTSLLSSNEWPIYVALMATSKGLAQRTDDPKMQEVLDVVAHEEERFLESMTTFYTVMASMLGLRIRPGLEYRDFAMAGAAVLDGLTLRTVLQQAAAELDSPDTQTGTATPHPGDESMSYNTRIAALPTMAFQAILDAFMEPDPDWSPQPELRQGLQSIITGLKSGTGFAWRPTVRKGPSTPRLPPPAGFLPLPPEPQAPTHFRLWDC